MPEKTSTSSPNSSRRSSSASDHPAVRPVRLICPDGLPGVSLSIGCSSALAQPRHAHDSFILGVVTAGTRCMEIASETFHIAAGEAFALPPGLAHSCTPEHGPCSYLAFSIAPAALPAQTREALCQCAFWRRDDPQPANALLRLSEACESPCGLLERQSLLAEALDLFSTQPRLAGAKEEDSAPPEPAPLLAEAVRHAQEAMVADLLPGLSLPALAEVCGLDMYALHRAFTRVVGLPPHAFQTHLRLRLAKQLLRGGASLIDAALGAGFCDQSHMHRHFTRLVGLTPAQYARAHAERE